MWQGPGPRCLIPGMGRGVAKKGMPLKQMAKAMTPSEKSIKDRAKLDGLKIAKLR